MLQAVTGTAPNRSPFHSAAPTRTQDAGPSPWTKSQIAAPPADGVVYPHLSRNYISRMLAPLSAAEHQQAAQLAPRLMSPHRPSPHFDPAVPSMAIGPSTGTRYSFTCCPMDHASPDGKRFTVDNFLDHAFKSGANTTISLTSQGDSRHSEYYKQNKHGGQYSVSSHGRPIFTTMVRDARGQPATASIFHNAVRNNQTGEVRNMKMIHINGWRDQTALSADAQMSLISQLKNQMTNGEFGNMAVHCSQGMHRTGYFATVLEGMDAVAKGRPPEIGSKLNWFRGARVANAVGVPAQLSQLAESEVRMNRLVAPARGRFN